MIENSETVPETGAFRARLLTSTRNDCNRDNNSSNTDCPLQLAVEKSSWSLTLKVFAVERNTTHIANIVQLLYDFSWERTVLQFS